MWRRAKMSVRAKASAVVVIEMGKWNTAEVTAQGDHFIVVINGNKVLDDHHPAFKSGAIGLQHTGQTIEFRNFKIKTL